MAKLSIFLVLFALAASGGLAQEILVPAPVVTDWGTWGQYEQCPPGTFVYGFQLKVESDQGLFGDDSALNGITLLCNSPSVNRKSFEYLKQNASTRAFATISSSQGHEGTMRKVFECASGFANGFELRSESDQGWNDDDTAANNFRLVCSNGQVLEGDGHSWGTWTGVQKCPRGLTICGIWTQVEAASDTDDTTLNNVVLGCCSGP